MMAALTTRGVETATKEHGDATKTLDDVSVSRWTKHGNDRLYINDLFSATTDVYVDLDEMSVTVSGTQIRSASAERDGDELVVQINRPSWNYEIVVGLGDEEDTTGTDADAGNDEGDDSGPDLGRFGVDI